MTVELRLLNQEKRYVNGLVKRFSQGARDDAHFIHFHAEVVPKPWLLTKKVRSRIFQHLSVPDILRQVLAELDVTYEFSGTYQPRDYCVQYRESDFDFASRLMEEEGIFYFFKHTDSSHQMVVTDASKQHPAVSGQGSVIYEELTGGEREEMRITVWEKTQELRSGECTLWDHCFELPGKNFEAKQKILDSVAVGTVTHKLQVGGNDQLEIYDFPGAYAQRFDGIDHHGAPRPQDLQEIFRDKERTVKLRMEQEQAMSLEIGGTGNCGQFLPGHKFTLKRHFDADGQFLLTRVEHEAQLGGNYRSDDALPFTYENRFGCIPVALPYRPQCVTREPMIAGIQTATVVGPAGEEIFCDKYGRIKVQFHWDREGKMDGDSSCWLRVAQVWAGNGWGAFFWPRIGHEVVVVFEEGDPDQPLIIGSVYNAQNMPPYQLPVKNTLTGIKSMSHRGKPYENFNGIVFDDTKGHEHLAIHSERHMSFNSEFDKAFRGGRHKHEMVSNVSTFVVGSLPGGGGSGGGGCTPCPPPYKPLGTVDPQGIPGINSVWVYGENLQVAVGLNHQLAIGSNLQICVNPTAIAEALGSSTLGGFDLPAGIKGLLSSGIGGNMQFTLGTNANIVLGKSFTLNMGETWAPASGKHVGTKIACAVLGAGTVVFAVLYGLENLFNTASARTVLVTVFQIFVEACLMAIMTIEAAYTKAEDHWTKGMRDIFSPIWEGGIADKTAKTAVGIAEVAIEALAVIALAATPAIIASATEAAE